MNVRKINPYFVGNTFLLYDYTTCNFGNEWGWPLVRSKTIHGNELHNSWIDIIRQLLWHWIVTSLYVIWFRVCEIVSANWKHSCFEDVISIFLPSLQMCVSSQICLSPVKIDKTMWKLREFTLAAFWQKCREINASIYSGCCFHHFTTFFL